MNASPPSGDEPDLVEAGSVRPYAVTGGKPPPSAADLPLEALVRAQGGPRQGMTGEQRQAVALASGGWLSVAELSAHLHLPVPVARVVVDNLVRTGSLQLQRVSGASGARGEAPSRAVLHSVLDGIRSL